MIRKARIEDVKTIHSLVNHFAERGLMLPRSLSELYENLRDFCVYEIDGKIVGCAAVHIVWEDLCELKSLAVREKYQKRGVGSALVKRCLSEGRKLGMPKMFVLTSQPEFFEKHGFKRISKDSLPHKIWAECVKCPKFPDCDEVAMLISLKG